MGTIRNKINKNSKNLDRQNLIAKGLWPHGIIYMWEDDDTGTNMDRLLASRAGNREDIFRFRKRNLYDLEE